MEENQEELEEDTEEYMMMFYVAAKNKESYRVEITLKGFSTNMEVDKEAATTIISEETFKKIRHRNLAQKKLEIKSAQVKFRTYIDVSVKVLGTGVLYDGQ